MGSDQDLAVLRTALDQLTNLLAAVRREDLDQPTPCEQWTVRDLVDHIVAAPEKFSRMLRGDSVDWSAPTPPAGDDPVGAFRARSADLLAASGDQGRDGRTSLDWQCAELAVHTWDLATALHRPTSDLEPEPAERGLAFMQASLTDDNRSRAFAPEQAAPEGADSYDRIAAFAGRSV